MLTPALEYCGFSNRAWSDAGNPKPAKLSESSQTGMEELESTFH